MSHWQILPVSQFHSYVQQWDNINESSFDSHPMLDSRFVLALLNFFDDKKTSLAIYSNDYGQIENILLLSFHNANFCRTFLPSQSQIAPILCKNPASLNTLFRSLPNYMLFIDIMCQDPLYTFNVDSLNNHENFHHVTTIGIDLSSTFEEYWKQRSKNLRKTVNRFFNRLEKDGISITEKSNKTLSELEQAIERYGYLESRGWKGAEGTALHPNNIQGKFYLDIIRKFNKTNQVEIFEIYFNEKHVASQMFLLNSSMILLLKTTYDEDYSQYAPGRLLCYQLLQHEFSTKRAKSIEFYTNATTDQISWCTGQRDIKHVTIYRSNLIMQAGKLVRKIKQLMIRT